MSVVRVFISARLTTHYTTFTFPRNVLVDNVWNPGTRIMPTVYR